LERRNEKAIRENQLLDFRQDEKAGAFFCECGRAKARGGVAAEEVIFPLNPSGWWLTTDRELSVEV